MATKKRPSTQSEALKNALEAIRSKYGDSSVLTEDSIAEKVETFSSGSYLLDTVCGNGVPKGRIIEMYGEPSHGKTTISLFVAASLQKQGGTCAFIDAENSFNREFAEKIGVNVSSLLVSQPGSLEETFDIIKAYVDSAAVDLIIVDSVAALVPKRVIEYDELLKEDMGIQAKLLSRGLQIIAGPASKSKTTIIFINQTRDKIGAWGNQQTTPGGKALKFYSSVRLLVARGEKIENTKDGHIGNVLKITATKCKTGFPFKTCEVNLMFDKGIDTARDMFDAAITKGIIAVEGKTYSFDGEKLGVAIANAAAALSSNEELSAKVKAALDSGTVEK
jgi:recombination protein RecA